MLSQKVVRPGVLHIAEDPHLSGLDLSSADYAVDPFADYLRVACPGSVHCCLGLCHLVDDQNAVVIAATGVVVAWIGLKTCSEWWTWKVWTRRVAVLVISAMGARTTVAKVVEGRVVTDKARRYGKNLFGVVDERLCRTAAGAGIARGPARPAAALVAVDADEIGVGGAGLLGTGRIDES